MFFTKNFTSEVKKDIEGCKILSVLMRDFGGIVAGGTSHAVMRGLSIEDYQRIHNTADVDLYFKTEASYLKAVDYVASCKNIHLQKSVTGLCHDVHLDDDNQVINKIQLVGCVFGSPKEIVSSFDFRNLESCLYFEKDKYCLMYSENAENEETLMIRHSRSPFLMHRVYKYLTYRGYSRLSKCSKRHVTDWIIKASSGFYNENTDRCPSIYVDLLNNQNFIKMTKDRNIVSDEDLVYMIGKIKEIIFKEIDVMTPMGYHTKDFYPAGSKDIVIEEIKRRAHANK